MVGKLTLTILLFFSYCFSYNFIIRGDSFLIGSLSSTHSAHSISRTNTHRKFNIHSGGRVKFSLQSSSSSSTSSLKTEVDATLKSMIDDNKNDIDNNNWDLVLFSPAKINLFLRILRRREDGFHDLASLFQTVSFGDTIKFKLLEKNDDENAEGKDIFECNLEGVPTDESNLIIRALNLFRKHTGVDRYFKVSLIKRVPMQGGLGGGSSNAATAMHAANQLTGCPASLNNLIEWSGEIGSDITFFLSKGTAYCTGRGEILRPVKPLEILPGVDRNRDGYDSVYIIKPSVGLSTPLVFKNLNLNALSPIDPETLLEAFTNESESNDDSSSSSTMGKNDKFVNDLEPPAFKVVPELLTIKTALQNLGFESVMMSGSGTSIFAIGEPSSTPEMVEKWNTFEKDYDVQVVKSKFISRSTTDENEWYPLPSGL